ncbi:MULTISPECIES: hypothetical protein [unclassified Aliivibrio]|jgi:hypothetical protein|uniref:hypothetical protein n=1 Tax=unclassified Aliivibrio TaxID=2645654 RepID=UPI00080ED2A8|nr:MULTISPECIES: hypothetical protein [unclassified Aliivibrio]OCH15092.1 hypothetical protein A6E03_15215 [Aliivibrio sp. 1S128]OCH16109.1 hypothetical protein A6E05_17850 [Aliivibrio sp. 1S165]OCH26849.1 hypothetical protein A6E06_09500 [Aliivibrio sp. 1S175]
MEAPLDMVNGAKFKTNKHGYVTVVDYYNCHTVIIAFDNTGNVRAISAAKLRNGLVTDRDVPPESIMVGEQFESAKHGLLTITQVESENMVVLTTVDGEEIRMLWPTVQKMKDKLEQLDAARNTKKSPTSLSDLTKRNKKTKEINNMFNKILKDYGKY